jgi:hypothetical protein
LAKESQETEEPKAAEPTSVSRRDRKQRQQAERREYGEPARVIRDESIHDHSRLRSGGTRQKDRRRVDFETKFLAADMDVIGGGECQPHFVPFDLDDRNFDLPVHDNLLADLSREHQHGLPSLVLDAASSSQLCRRKDRAEVTAGSHSIA